MNRINIIGPPGSGKTTLARELAQIYELPVIHMDYWAHTEEYDYLKNRDTFVGKIALECEQDEWIMEGQYLPTLQDRIPRANITLVLDFPRYVYMPRILKRRIQYHNKVREEMIEGWQEHLNRDFVKHIMNYQSVHRPKLMNELRKYPDANIVTLFNPRQVRKYIKSLK